VVIDSLRGYVDSAESIVTSLVVLALLSAWAGLQRQQTVLVFGVAFDRRRAFLVVAAFCLLATLGLAATFLRLGDLLLSVDDRNFIAAATVVMTHAWLLNPFAYYGSHSVTSLFVAGGGGTLTFVWWLCATALATLMDRKLSIRNALIAAVWIAAGTGAFMAMARVNDIVASRLQALDNRAALEVSLVYGERANAVLFFTIVGGMLFLIVNMLQALLLLPRTETEMDRSNVPG